MQHTAQPTPTLRALCHLAICLAIAAHATTAFGQRDGSQRKNAKSGAAKPNNADATVGTTAPAGETAPAQTPATGRVAAADFNGDGRAAAAELTGVYTATTGQAGATASGGASGVGRKKGAQAGGGQLAGTKLHIKIDRLASDAEIATATRAAGNGTLASAISEMRCGTVSFDNGPPITINLAIGATVGGQTVIYLLSEKPLSAQAPQGATASGGAVGFIEMRLNGADGPGSLYVSTQVVIKAGGVSARGGVSVATRLAVEKSQ